MGAIVIGVGAKKGGVGKTSIVFSLAQILSILGYKVLCCDNDEQHNLTSHLGIKKISCISNFLNTTYTIDKFNILLSNYIESSEYPLIDCVSCLTSINNISHNKINMYEKLIKSQKYNYDVILVDFSPNFGSNQNTMLFNVIDAMILPVILSQYSINGLFEAVDFLKKNNKNYTVVPNMVRTTKLGKIKTKTDVNILKLLKETFKNTFFDSFIPYDKYIDFSATTGKINFLHYYKSAISNIGFMNLASFVFGLRDCSDRIKEQRNRYLIQRVKNVRK